MSRALSKRRSGLAALLEIVAPRRQPEQRQAFLAMPSPQRIESLVGPYQRLVELARLDPALADGLGQHAGDVLAIEHCGTS
jgi:hypothetical protein